MALGPRSKSELELHWQHQLDHVRADIRNVYRRLQNEVEGEAFNVIAEHYQETGKLIDLRSEHGTIESLAAEAAQKLLPEGR